MANEASDNPKPLGQVLLEAGHPPSVVDKPKAIMSQAGFQQLMKEAGVTPEKLSTVLKEGLEATKLFGKDAVRHPDYMARHKYMETGLKLLGIQESPAPAGGNTFNFNQTNINADPNTPEAKAIIDNTLDILMEQTRAT